MPLHLTNKKTCQRKRPLATKGELNNTNLNSHPACFAQLQSIFISPDNVFLKNQIFNPVIISDNSSTPFFDYSGFQMPISDQQLALMPAFFYAIALYWSNIQSILQAVVSKSLIKSLSRKIDGNVQPGRVSICNPLAAKGSFLTGRLIVFLLRSIYSWDCGRK
jgi:hypothetical protein